MSDKKLFNYFFESVPNCEMCGRDATFHKVLGQRLNQSQGFNPRKKTGISVSVLQCDKCALVYPNPIPIPSNIQNHYGVPPESYWKPEYFIIEPYYFQRQITKTKELLNFKKGMVALDIGAGIGKAMIAMKASDFDVYGLEPSEPFYQKAITEMNIPNDRLQLGKMEDIDYPKEFFDFITFGAVLEHLFHPAASIERALTWLKPGGIIHLEVPSSKYLMARFLNFYFRLRGTNYVTHLSPMHEPFHIYEFDLRSFDEHARNSNLHKIVYFEYYPCAPDHLNKITQKFLNKIMTVTNTGMQLAVWLKKIR